MPSTSSTRTSPWSSPSDSITWSGSAPTRNRSGSRKRAFFARAGPRSSARPTRRSRLRARARQSVRRSRLRGRRFRRMLAGRRSWDFLDAARRALGRAADTGLAGPIQVANAATALMALAALSTGCRCPGPRSTRACGGAPARAASSVSADPRGFEWVLDVAHNPAAAATLAAEPGATPGAGPHPGGLRHARRQGRGGSHRGAAGQSSMAGCSDCRRSARHRRRRTCAQRAARPASTMEPAGRCRRP